MGLFGSSLERLSYAATLHDIGKLGSDGKGKVPFHARVGAEIIDHVDYLKDVSSIIKFHHDHYADTKIDVPLEAGIIHLADAFDHLVNDSKLSKKEALNKLGADKGLVYDPKALRALTSITKGQSA
jgi:response regulator RpfG family c-di-GMP phosphodiesterase